MKAAWLDVSAQLTESQTWDATSACRICDDASPRRAVAVIQEEPRIDLLECGNCFGCSASRMPNESFLADYYASFYDTEQLSQEITFLSPARLARHIIRLAPTDLRGSQSPIRICDFGGGDGSLSIAIARALDRPAEVTVVDICDPAPREEQRVTLTYMHSLDDARGSFDLVLASAILEHIPELRATLEGLATLLDGGAYLYARTPYWRPFTRLFKVDLGYPAHVHDLGPRFWFGVGAALSVGLEVVHSRASVVETTLRHQPLRTVAAYLLKSPSWLESVVRGPTPRPLWNLVGGWEVLMAGRR